MQRVLAQARSVRGRQRVLAAVPALALAITAVGVATSGPAAAAAQPEAVSAAFAAVGGETTGAAVTGASVTKPASWSGSAASTTVFRPALAFTSSGAAASVQAVSSTPRRAAIRGDRYLTARVNIRTGPSLKARVVTVLPRGSKVLATKATRGQFTQIVFRGQTRYAATRYLSTKRPQQAKAKTSKVSSKSATVSRARCGSGSVESRLSSDAVLVHRTLCARFPQISAFGGYRSGGGSYHGSGRAVDAMIGNRATGWAMANFVRKNRKALGVSEVIYARKIWTVQRGGEGWRSMSDRGSVSANHLDHVHVSVYGSAAS